MAVLGNAKQLCACHSKSIKLNVRGIVAADFTFSCLCPGPWLNVMLLEMTTRAVTRLGT